MDVQLLHVFKGFEIGIVFGADHALAAKMTFVGCMEDRTAHGQQSTDMRAGQDMIVWLSYQPFKALLNPKNFVTKPCGSLHNRANHGVEARSVTTTGQHANTTSLL